jgi:hypothetical protein
MTLRTVLGLALVAGLVVPAAGQEPSIRLGGGPGGSLPVFSMAGQRSLLPLLKRPEVQNAISLDLKQKQALEDLLNNPQRSAIRINAVNEGDRDPEKIRKQIEDQIKAQQGGVEERIKSVLKPDQYDRLLQLDLQWRGPLALADQKVADRLKIAQESRREIAPIAGEYHAVKAKVMMELAQQSQEGSGGQVRVMMKLNTKELENPLSPSYKKLDAAKKEAEKKILAVLSPEDKATWKQAQGAPFVFRTDQRGNRF